MKHNEVMEHYVASQKKKRITTFPDIQFKVIYYFVIKTEHGNCCSFSKSYDVFMLVCYKFALFNLDNDSNVISNGKS